MGNNFMGVNGLLITPNNKFLFISVDYYLLQYEMETQTEVQDYEDIMDTYTYTMQATKDSSMLYCADYSGYITKISIEKKEVVKTYGKIGLNTMSIILSTNETELWVQRNKD